MGVSQEHQKTGAVSLQRLSGACRWTLTEVLGLGSHHCYLADEFSNTTLYRVRKYMRELKNKGLTPFTDQKRTTVPDRYAKSKPDLIHCGLIKQSPDSTYKLV